MDIATVIFVSLLCLAAFLVTMTVRRDFRTRERQTRQQARAPQNPRRKP